MFNGYRRPDEKTPDNCNNLFVVTNFTVQFSIWIYRNIFNRICSLGIPACILYLPACSSDSARLVNIILSRARQNFLSIPVWIRINRYVVMILISRANLRHDRIVVHSIDFIVTTTRNAFFFFFVAREHNFTIVMQLGVHLRGFGVECTP